jgi:mannan endo-1,6-alpha-mannosidase
VYLGSLAKKLELMLMCQYSGGTDGATCGEHWHDNSTWVGNYGVGQQMSAMSIFQSLLIDQAPALVTNATGGTSEGNAAAGTDSGTDSDGSLDLPVTSADKAGAGIVTTLVLCSFDRRYLVYGRQSVVQCIS